MRIHKNLLIGALSLSFIMHLTHLTESVRDFVREINNLTEWLDMYSILVFLTRSINILTIITGACGLFLYFKRPEKKLNNWLVSFIVIENFKIITTILAMLRFPEQYFPSTTQVGFLYYAYLVVMLFTMILSINYFSRIKNIEMEYNGATGASLAKSKLTRFLNWLTDYLFIIAISYDKYYVLNQTLDLKYIFIICLLIYYFYSEALFGRTLGKAFTNTVVVRTGNTSYTVLVRTLSRLIPFEPFSFLSRGAQGWHDRISGMYLYKLDK